MIKVGRIITGSFGFLLVLLLLLGVFSAPAQAYATGEPVQNTGKSATVTINSNVGIAVQFRSTKEKTDDTVYYSTGDGSGYLFASGDVSGLPESGTIYLAIEPKLGNSNTYTSILIDGESKKFHNGTDPNVYAVPVAGKYEIIVSGKESVSYTIMWTNSGATNVEGTDFAGSDCVIGNGKAYVKAVYDNATDMKDITSTIANIEKGCVDDDGKGYVAIEAGNIVDFAFIPDYGYQLTSIKANDNPLVAQEELNEFRFKMPTSHIHFSATFTKTDDVVSANAQSVSGGSVSLADGELSSGTARLDVNDAEVGNQDAFKEAAQGYIVSEYLDISLSNVFYKGTENAGDVWATKVETLDNPAEITLRLKEGIDTETVKIVHEKAEGQFDLLDASYNPETQEVTFSTSSFSKYAIAYVESSNAPTDATYWIDFGPGLWSVGGVEVGVQTEGLSDDDKNVQLSIEDAITLSNFDPSTMDAILVVDEDVTLYLNVDDNGNTKLADVEGGVEVLPPEGSMWFSVVEKPVVAPPSVGPSTTTVTIPVSGEENTVHAEVAVSGATVEVKPLDVDEIGKIVGDDVQTGVVEIDLSSLNSDVKQVLLPVATLEAITQAAEDAGNDTESIAIITPQGAVEMDDAAMRAVLDQAEGESVVLSLNNTGNSQLSAAQNAALEGMEVHGGFEVYFECPVTGNRIGDFRGGSATISIHFEAPEGKKGSGFSIWFVSDEGDLQKMKTFHVGAKLVTSVPHMSDYVIVYEDHPAYEDCERGSECPIAQFPDVKAGAWYHDGLHWAVENGVLKGGDDGKMTPGEAIDRQMLMVILHRYAQGAGMSTSVYEDTNILSYDGAEDVSTWAMESMQWACGAGIMKGYNGTDLAPKDELTREQMATFLHRFAIFMGFDVSVGEDTNILSYDDADQISGWAMEAMQWACGAGVITGYTDAAGNHAGELGPIDDCSRAQAATMMMRFDAVS